MAGKEQAHSRTMTDSEQKKEQRKNREIAVKEQKKRTVNIPNCFTCQSEGILYREIPSFYPLQWQGRWEKGPLYCQYMYFCGFGRLPVLNTWICTMLG